MKYFTYIIIFSLSLLTSCARKEARKPVMIKTNTFLKESAEKNRKLLAKQEAIIDSITSRDTLHTYLTSQDGFKYYYIDKNTDNNYVLKFGDVVEFTYNISHIHGKEIYSKEEKKVITYHVDKEELFFGLRTAIKLLKVNEQAVFFFPSEIAFGYHGDKDRIGINEPIMVKVHILKITPEKELEKNDLKKDENNEIITN
ncbi:gliding motility-associated peptidyl-prolyl isomerase GldI [Capnocytophaga catalasegens]|uniref:Peptidyl-prolyl cis-trans isomerase n=1 Tax=Capnocytophaga catalasegens TaxID=1004260 RepID=A0AAV5AYV1_9FLAO|nr:gliding motility-associated peptidyl-prolyl isomerase GldI [Capnocytophaga catalasegens]GIZ14813.1 peptidyl-prolyl cis-trans isomerase [Capnocytophaga catalasegens]GJM51181.1 peptidyl-prolyl cis-trans isomerase [Capnocytophaga catalasegens]GJM53508.1 peptidyl-prolyl cis-trans isomerase [Capnocytophaga catalasegens]